MTDIDLERRIVHADGPDGRTVELPYDTLVVATGATLSYFGHDEFARFAPGMKTVEDARDLRDRILVAFEMAELATDPRERAEWLTFVVIGAGPTGVELVGQVAELAHKVLPRDYRTVDTTEARILLLEGAGAVLGPFHPKLQRYSRKRLGKMGVEIRLNTLAVGMDDGSVTVQGPEVDEAIRARSWIWAAGVQASPLAAMLAAKTGAQTDRAGRVAVDPDCTLPGHPDVFAIGDMVLLNDLPGVAEPALQEGAYVGNVHVKAGGRRAQRAVRLRRQGQHGHHRRPRGGRAGVRPAVHRSGRLPDVGLRPPAPPRRLGQLTRHALHVGPRARVLEEPRAPDHHVRPGARAGVPFRRRGASRRRPGCPLSAGPAFRPAGERHTAHHRT